MKKVILCLFVLSLINGIDCGQAEASENAETEQANSEHRGKFEQFKNWLGGLFHKNKDISSDMVQEKTTEPVETVQSPEKSEEPEILPNIENESDKKDETSIEEPEKEPAQNTESTSEPYDKKTEIFVEKPVTIINNTKTTDTHEDAGDIPTTLPLLHKTDNIYNKIADRISGLSEDRSSEYRIYSAKITQNWNFLCERSLKRVRPWAIANLDPYLKNIPCVFYVFGGPDISYACEFFPYANEYVLVGLEPLGRFSSIKRLVNSGNLEIFGTAINTYLRKGYFITSEMGKHFSKSDGIHGGLSMVLLQLSRLNYDIISVESMGINDEGTLVADGPDVLSAIKIVFKKDPSTDELSTAYYIRMDLSNGNMSRLKKLASFVKNKNFVTFVKSASYALQDKDFTTLRNFILYNTEAILQDDTGIAFNLLNRWNIRIFGQYSGATLKIFKNYIQEDMVRYFQNHRATPINFQLGYGFDQKRPALVLALRKNSPRIPVDIVDCQERGERKNSPLKAIKKKIYEKRILKKLILK